MRIYSKTKDYYDSAQAYGQDKTIGYTRNPNEIKLTEEEDRELGLDKIYMPCLNHGNVVAPRKIIGFCGRIYPVYHFSYIAMDSVQPIPDRYCYCNDDIRRFLRYKSLKKYRERYIEEPKGWWNSRYSNSNEKDIIKFFTEYKNSNKFEHVFLKYEAPIWEYKPDRHKPKIIINPSNLGNSEFFKIHNAYQAFQELSMYLTSTLAKEIEPDPDNVPDKYLAKAKGFDDWSFRKQPTKKGRKAKKRN